jgi:branched-chain amino acid transport system ATP-binding protein
MAALLETHGLSKHFGGLAAIHDLDVAVEEGEILGVIGPNGAGKSTFFNAISGHVRPSGGSVEFLGRDITGQKAHVIARAGISRVFQQGITFRGVSLVRNVLRTAAARAEKSRLREEALRILDFVGLTALAERDPGGLPYGQQMALGLAVALASAPRLLLLDEPATGMNPTESDVMIEHIRRISESGVTVVIVEHDMRLVRSLCDRLVCLNFGEKLCEGPPEFVMSHPQVAAAYLGRGGFHAA